MRVVCQACAADAGALDRVGRRDTCPSCGVDLHTCRQCRFYDPRAYNACAEPQAERVLDKERGNFCDYFAATEAVPARAQAPSAAPSTRAELDRLFRRR